MVFASIIPEKTNESMIEYLLKDVLIISGHILTQFLRLFSFRRARSNFFSLRNILNVISVKINNGVSIPTDVMLRPETFRTLKNVPRSRACDFSVILVPIFAKKCHGINSLQLYQEKLSVTSMGYHYLPAWKLLAREEFDFPLDRKLIMDCTFF